ncbi:MAG: Asp23/Gls24 family envelope stress response protein [Candidatus Caldatribacteriota bacterium]|nr:Asp23/Gls24 family envelope stress response protein [Candidatus Caldatribacteriota bacterium]
METIKTIYGKVNIPKEIIENIVRVILKDIKGVAKTKKPIMEEMSDISKKNARKVNKNTKNVKVEIKNNRLSINLSIILERGIRIPDIAWEIQNGIKQELKKIIGVENVEINIHVQGIQFPKKLQSKRDLVTSNLFVKVF